MILINRGRDVKRSATGDVVYNVLLVITVELDIRPLFFFLFFFISNRNVIRESRVVLGDFVIFRPRLEIFIKLYTKPLERLQQLQAALCSLQQ